MIDSETRTGRYWFSCRIPASLPPSRGTPVPGRREASRIDSGHLPVEISRPWPEARQPRSPARTQFENPMFTLAYSATAMGPYCRIAISRTPSSSTSASPQRNTPDNVLAVLDRPGSAGHLLRLRQRLSAGAVPRDSTRRGKNHTGVRRPGGSQVQGHRSLNEEARLIDSVRNPVRPSRDQLRSALDQRVPEAAWCSEYLAALALGEKSEVPVASNDSVIFAAVEVAHELAQGGEARRLLADWPRCTP